MTELRATAARLGSPVGDLLVAVDSAERTASDGLPVRLLRVQFACGDDVERRFEAGLDRQGYSARWEANGVEPVERALAAYFAGRTDAFDELELAPGGTPFQTLVWAELCRIPYGETRSYGQLAEAIGRPTASRAVGMANNANPIAIVVPCHRVIGSGGKLVGYAGGLERKQALLAHEQRDALLFS